MGPPKYTDEYRRETVGRIISTDRSVAVVAGELGMSEKTPGRWVVDRRRRHHSSIGCRIPGRAMDDFSRRTAPGPESLPIAA
ncbi:MAG: hypothetical protein ACI36T_02785 [Eggerthellaceae bacterium]